MFTRVFQKAWDKAKRRVEREKKIIERRKKLKRKFRTINRLKNITLKKNL